jgi:hypothetical protein
MQKNLRVIESAKECALFRFSLLAHRMVEEAAESIRQAIRRDAEADTQPARQALHLLLAEGAAFEGRKAALFGSYLERAMQTMYTDLREGLHDLSANSLSLIDDQVVDRQIQVDHLVQALRDADRENLGRISLMISILHNKREVHERENPFRPYLMARALLEAVRAQAGDGAVAAILLDRLVASMAVQLPAYLGAIREVFESHGVQARFMAQAAPSSVRTYGTVPATGVAMASTGEAGLQALEDMLTRLFARASGEAGTPPASSMPLLKQLNACQRHAAAGLAVDERLAPSQNQLFLLREKIALPDSDRLARATLQMVAVLYELLLADARIPAQVREQIGRLQVPVLKAAILEPGLLRDHPARRLLNRLGSVGSGEPEMVEEISRIAGKILHEFEDDLAIFSACIEAFDRFLASCLRHADAASDRIIDAVERARAGVAMERLLASLGVDQRIAGFILEFWLPLMFSRKEEGADGLGSCRALLAKLVWSAQPWYTPEQRNERVKRLPSLLTRLKSSLLLAGLPEEACRIALDDVVAVHFQVLRAAPAAAGQAYPDEGALLRLFSGFPALGGDSLAGLAPDPAAILARLRRQGLDLVAETAGEAPSAVQGEAAVLAQLELGVAVARGEADGQLGRVVWICPDRSLFVLKFKEDAAPLLYTAQVLEKAMREHALRLVERAPAFDRALESLLFGPGKPAP